jgi:hypothetical protein
MPDFETRLKDVSRAAWLIWTANGLGLDDFELEQTSKSATDTAINAYVEGISNKDWVDDTLMGLGSEELTKTIMVPGNPPAHQTLNSPINSIVAAAKTEAPAINVGVIGRGGEIAKQTRNQKDGLPAQDAHRSVKESADAVDSSRRPPDPQRALREPVSVCNRTSLSHG